MTYDLWRSICFILLLICFFFISKRKHFTIQLYTIGVIVLFFICSIIRTIPIENLFLKFDSMEKAARYMYGNHITEIYEQADFAFIIITNRSNTRYGSLIKKNGFWQVQVPDYKIKTQLFEDKIVLVKKIKELDVAFIEIQYIDTKEEAMDIYDNEDNYIFVQTKKLSEIFHPYEHTYRFVIKNVQERPYIKIDGKNFGIN